jgi:ATP-dependent Lon protease
LNIDLNNHDATIGFAKEYISSMDENYNNIARAIKDKIKKSKIEFALPEELKEINNLGEIGDDIKGR